MKKSYILIALAMVAAMTVSCKNNKKAEADEADAEVIEAAKTILTDDVLATLDEIAKPLINDSGVENIAEFIAAHLTEDDKLVKPDYLFDPSVVNDLVSKTQKINALAILISELHIRKAYEMPVSETEEAIARLTAELNHPISPEYRSNKTASERLVENYKQCKERGEVDYFWRFNFALINEMDYLIAHNVDLVFNNISEEQYHSYYNRYKACSEAVGELAKYDSEIAEMYNIYSEFSHFSNNEERAEAYKTLDGARKLYIDSKERRTARHYAFLK